MRLTEWNTLQKRVVNSLSRASRLRSSNQHHSALSCGENHKTDFSLKYTAVSNRLTYATTRFVISIAKPKSSVTLLAMSLFSRRAGSYRPIARAHLWWPVGNRPYSLYGFLKPPLRQNHHKGRANLPDLINSTNSESAPLQDIARHRFSTPASSAKSQHAYYE